MKRLIFLILFLAMLAVPVAAIDITAPQAPESAQKYMPQETESFGEGVWYIIKSAITALKPGIAEAAGVCLALIATVLLTSLVQTFSGAAKHISNLVSTLAIGLLLFQATNSLIRLGTETVTEISEYGKLLLPVMTAALAAQGGCTSSAALYTGTAFFSALLTSVTTSFLIPLIYAYLCLCIANSALADDILKKLRDFLKWLITWALKALLYIFTGYISITGVVSGTADASAVKAARLAISGSIPVVGSILSDATETILVSAGIVKSTAGVYGLLAILAIGIGPFLEVGLQYLFLKLTAAVCGVFGTKCAVGLVQDFSTAMGFLLAMIGTVCLLLLISTVCYMKGVG